MVITQSYENYVFTCVRSQGLMFGIVGQLLGGWPAAWLAGPSLEGGPGKSVCLSGKALSGGWAAAPLDCWTTN